MPSRTHIQGRAVDDDAQRPVVAPHLPGPTVEEGLTREWVDNFIRALTVELGKIVQPIGTRYTVTGFNYDRTLTSTTVRTARCQVGNVTVKTNGPVHMLVRLHDAADDKAVVTPLTTPTNTGDVLATLLRDLKTRGWLG